MAQKQFRYSVTLQYKPAGHQRPYDEGQDDQLVFEQGEALPLPNVGDTVSYLEGGTVVARKVLTRHFDYQGEWCTVNIVVTDVPDGEMLARIKE